MGLTFKDPLRAALIGRGTFNGFRGLDQFVPITSAERAALIKRLELDDQNMVCMSCGSTKPMAWYLANGAVSCCTDREMVQTADMLSELQALRAAPTAAPILKLVRALQRADTEFNRASAGAEQPRLNKAGTSYHAAKSKLFTAAKAANREKP